MKYDVSVTSTSLQNQCLTSSNNKGAIDPKKLELG